MTSISAEYVETKVFLKIRSHAVCRNESHMVQMSFLMNIFSMLNNLNNIIVRSSQTFFKIPHHTVVVQKIYLYSHGNKLFVI